MDSSPFLRKSVDVLVDSVILVLSTRCYLTHVKWGWKREITMGVLKGKVSFLNLENLGVISGQRGVVTVTNDEIQLIGLECDVIKLDNEEGVVRSSLAVV